MLDFFFIMERAPTGPLGPLGHYRLAQELQILKQKLTSSRFWSRYPESFISDLTNLARFRAKVPHIIKNKNPL